MEAAKLKLGLGMDTAVVSLSSSPSSSSSANKLMLGTSRSAPYPRLLLKRSSNNGVRSRVRSAPSSSSSASAATTMPPAEKRKEKDLVFVAGATGRVGSRTVRELIRLGFRVRAAVRNPERTATLLQSVQELKLDDGGDKLEIVECDLEKQPQEGIVSAIGNASLVVCSIGASEKEIFDVTGPYRIDYMATDKLVQAASAAKVDHFILVTSLGTNKIGFPAFLLNLFWGVLCWKRRAEEALIASGIPYTIVRPGGMERPTDAYKETHNLVVAPENTYVGGQVSNLQVAELIAAMAKNRRAAYCKVVEVIAETTAPLLPMDQLLNAVPANREPPAAADAEEEQQQQEVKAEDTVVVEPESDPPAAATRPLSPYTAYEGLKPPSSPSPASAAAGSSNKQLQQVAVVEEAAASTPPPATSSSRPLSPYTAFVDLKPPSSPSPSSSSSAKSTGGGSSSTGASVLDSSANGTPTSTSSNTVSQVQAGEKQQKQQPLSPYTRYEDLKPPSSPTPSAPKI